MVVLVDMACRPYMFLVSLVVPSFSYDLLI